MRFNEGYGVSITKYKIITNFSDYNIEKDVAIKNQGEFILLKGEWHDFNISLCLRWDTHLMQPLDVSTPGSQAVTLGPGFPPSIPLVLGLWTWTELYPWLPWFSSLQIAGYGISLPPIPTINLLLHISVYILLVLLPQRTLYGFWLRNTSSDHLQVSSF